MQPERKPNIVPLPTTANDYLLAHQGILAAHLAPGHGALHRGRAGGGAAPVRLNRPARRALRALGPAAVQAQSADALAWLRKIHDATQKLSYTGTFVYQNGAAARPRASRATSILGDIEKLEVMDGVPREIVRTKDTVRCYLPAPAW